MSACWWVLPVSAASRSAICNSVRAAADCPAWCRASARPLSARISPSRSVALWDRPSAFAAFDGRLAVSLAQGYLAEVAKPVGCAGLVADAAAQGDRSLEMPAASGNWPRRRLSPPHEGRGRSPRRPSRWCPPSTGRARYRYAAASSKRPSSISVAASRASVRATPVASPALLVDRQCLAEIVHSSRIGIRRSCSVMARLVSTSAWRIQLVGAAEGPPARTSSSRPPRGPWPLTVQMLPRPFSARPSLITSADWRAASSA